MSTSVSREIVGTLWIIWLAIWVLAARNTKTTQWREPAKSWLMHRMPMYLAAWLLIERGHLPFPLENRFLPAVSSVQVSGIAMVAAGLGFAIMARWYLGSNWSGAVTVKEDHSLVRSGPYKYVRHPIYTGILIGLCGTAVVDGAWHSVLAVGFALFGLVYKSRIEEERMLKTFPEYEEYRRETAALIPLLY